MLISDHKLIYIGFSRKIYIYRGHVLQVKSKTQILNRTLVIIKTQMLKMMLTTNQLVFETIYFLFVLIHAMNKSPYFLFANNKSIHSHVVSIILRTRVINKVHVWCLGDTIMTYMDNILIYRSNNFFKECMFCICTSI